MLSLPTLNPALACILSDKLLLEPDLWPNCGVAGIGFPSS
jgi:hypothetical protein